MLLIGSKFWQPKIKWVCLQSPLVSQTFYLTISGEHQKIRQPKRVRTIWSIGTTRKYLDELAKSMNFDPLVASNWNVVHYDDFRNRVRATHHCLPTCLIYAYIGFIIAKKVRNSAQHAESSLQV